MLALTDQVVLGDDVIGPEGVIKDGTIALTVISFIGTQRPRIREKQPTLKHDHVGARCGHE